MNPARSIGPAVIAGIYDSLWIYILATTLGAAVATTLGAAVATKVYQVIHE